MHNLGGELNALFDPNRETDGAGEPDLIGEPMSDGFSATSDEPVMHSLARRQAAALVAQQGGNSHDEDVVEYEEDESMGRSESEDEDAVAEGEPADQPALAPALLAAGSPGNVAPMASPDGRNDGQPAAQEVEAARAAAAVAAYAQQMRADEEEDEAANAADEADDDAYIDHDDYAVPVVEHTLIWPEDRKTNFPFPASELVDPVVTNGVIPGSRRWRFHSAPNSEEERKATSKILNILIDQGFDHDQCTITYPPGSGRDRYVQIYFKKLEDYIRSAHLKLSWNRLPLEHAYAAAPLRKRNTVLKVTNVLTGDADGLIVGRLFEEMDPYLSIDNIWRLDRSILVRGQTVTTPGNTILALATYKKHPNGGFYGPEDIPGWFDTTKGVFAIHFIGRNKRCGWCKQDRTMPLNHTTEECIYRRCPHCGKKGHAEAHCPGQAPPAKRRCKIIKLAK